MIVIAVTTIQFLPIIMGQPISVGYPLIKKWTQTRWSNDIPFILQESTTRGYHHHYHQICTIGANKRSPHHSDLECLGTFGNWFWDLIVGNKSIVLNFYQQRPVFALKNYPRPQRPKRPMKANKGQQCPKLQIFFVIITIQCKIINKCQYDT